MTEPTPTSPPITTSPEPGEDSAPESANNPPQTDVTEDGTPEYAEPGAEDGDAAATSDGDVVMGETTSVAEDEVAPGEGVSVDVVPGEGAPENDVPADEDHLPPGQTAVPVGDEVVVDDDTMRLAIEAILMVTDEPLPVLTLARAVGRPTGDVGEALGALAAEYTEQGRGFDLREVGGGWRYYTRVEAAAYVERFVLDGQQARLTQAALETLSVVAYKQPVSRARVSAIRGVNVDGVMRTLVARGLVEEAGADTESQATLYRTTSYFLERMGMQSLDDLPELAPYLPDMDDIEDELAAQTLPPAPAPEAPSTPDAEESGTPDTPEAGGDDDDQVAAGQLDEDPGIDGDLGAESPELEADDDSTADEQDEDPGIDGDLGTEPADLDDEDESAAGELDEDPGIDGDLSASEGVRDGR